MITALGGAVTGAVGVAQGATRGTVSVIAPVPAPGNPALPLVAGGDIWEGTYSSATGSSAPSKIFEFSAAGTLLKSLTVPGQDLGETHGVQVATTTANGDLVVLDDTSGRVLLLNPKTDSFTLYSTIPELPVCGSGSTECSDESQAQTPEPDYAAWGPDGGLYITDYQQGVIWRVPSHGGIPSVWLQVPELDGGMFGTAGLVMLKDHDTLLFDQASTMDPNGGAGSTGALYSVQVEPDGEPGPLKLLWTSDPGALPDGFAVTTSGDIYMAQIGLSANDIIELSPSGTPIATFGTPVTGANGSPIPFDEPSGVAFLGGELVIANQSYLTGNTADMALLGLATGEQGAPVYVPSDAGPKAAPKRRHRPAKKHHRRTKRRKTSTHHR